MKEKKRHKSPYTCLACHSAFSKAVKGCCPACGSANIKQTKAVHEKKHTTQRWRIPVLIALWSVLIVEIYHRIQ